MNKVTFKYGNRTYCYETTLQYNQDVVEPEFHLGEHLMIDIKEHLLHMNPRPKGDFIHDVVFEDEYGIIGTAKDFSDIGNFTITTKNKLL